jgi:hypothetical protein
MISCYTSPSPRAQKLIPALGFFLAATISAQAALTIDSASWTNALGSASNSGLSATGITWGNNTNTGATSGNVDNCAIYAIIDGDTGTAGNQNFTLGLGETLTFAGTAELKSVTGTDGTIQFRFGLFDVNGSANVNGWLGYFAANTTISTQSGGGVYERILNNTNAYYSSLSGNAVLASGAAATPVAGARLTNDTYSMSLSFTRATATSLSISSSMIRTTGGNNYVSVNNYTDSSVNSFNFNRLGFLAGSGLDADQVVLSNLSLTAIPEPSSFAALAGLGAIGLVASRRRRSVR